METSNDVQRIVTLGRQLQFVAQHGKATAGEKEWAATQGAGLVNFARGHFATFGPAAALGMGGQAYMAQLEKHAAATVAGIQRRGPQGAGVWSWDPNKWGMTPAQANAYDVAKAETAAATSAANPGFLDAISQTAQGVTKSAGGVYTALLWTAGAGLVIWGISEIVAARGESLATGYVRTARAIKQA